jgi:D-glycero-D-manno-heptose 1,7-bisphosphate phosphatase
MPLDSGHLVILARDGVVNQRCEGPITSVDSWQPIPGSLEAIARLNQAGFAVVVVTNQPAVGDGELAITDLNAIHARFQSALARVGGHVDGIFFCPHETSSNCGCRMPAPGLMAAISSRFGVALDSVPLVGDSTIHADTAVAAGASPIMVRTGNGQSTFENDKHSRRFRWFDDLAAAACYVLESSSPA